MSLEMVVPFAGLAFPCSGWPGCLLTRHTVRVARRGPSPPPARPRVLRRHHEVGQPAAAVRAPEAQLDQRHVATAGVHQGLQVHLALMAARGQRARHGSGRWRGGR